MPDRTDPARGGLSRREVLRRGAIVGGNLLWIAPAIQTLTPKAYAQTAAFACCDCRAGNAGENKGGTNAAFKLCPTGSIASESDCNSACAAQGPNGGKAYAFQTSGSPLTCNATSGCVA